MTASDRAVGRPASPSWPGSASGARICLQLPSWRSVFEFGAVGMRLGRVRHRARVQVGLRDRCSSPCRSSTPRRSPPAGQVTVALSSVTVTGPCHRHVAVVRDQIAVADDGVDRAVGRRTGGLDQRDARPLDRYHRLGSRCSSSCRWHAPGPCSSPSRSPGRPA